MSNTKYLPVIAWRTIVQNVVMLTATTYRIDALPVDENEPGSTDREIGNYFKDYIGHTYLIIASTSTTIDLEDSFECGVGPQTDQVGIVYQSVIEGDSPFLAPVYYTYLDPSALDYSRAIELAVLWDQEHPAVKIIPDTTNFDGNFDANDDDLQKILNKLDNISVQGAQGTQGQAIQGIQGVQGQAIQGIQGTSIQGTQGLQGLQGLQGSAIQGLQGSAIQGAQGTQGQSIQGTQGLQGLQGASVQGTQGTSVQGAQGITGATNIATIETALLGEDNTQTITPAVLVDVIKLWAIQGTQGTQGLQGQSIQGATGTDGISVSIIGSVADVNVNPPNNPNTTLDTAFPDAEVGNGVIDEATGDLWVYYGSTWSNVGNIRGPQGVQGTQGASLQGTQGLQGASVQGAAGTQGTQGQSIQGTQGIQGESIQGAQGQSVQGTQGLQGSAIQGVQGVQGIQGQSIQGVQGQSVQGTQGVHGIAGPVEIASIEQALLGEDNVQSITPALLMDVIKLVGVQGVQGLQGLQGSAIQGAQGTQGQSIQGTQGLQGLQGQSIQGIQGASVQGAQGTQGQSIQGVQGQSIQGIQGTQGLQGKAFTLRGAYTVGITYYTNDYVTHNGRTYIIIQTVTGSVDVVPASNPNIFLDITGTQGTQGAQGVQGQAIQGTQGLQGAGYIYSAIWLLYGTYAANIHVISNVGSTYICKQSHQATDGTSEPGVGANWQTYWSVWAAKGSQGTVGSQGTIGSGTQGAQGQAIQGAQGQAIQGVQGQSIQGAQGLQGKSFTPRGAYSESYVSYYTNDYVTKNGRTYILLTNITSSPGVTPEGNPHIFLDITGSQGATGTGTQGSQGAIGSGTQGAQGLQGQAIQGAQGTSIQGTQGLQGASNGGNSYETYLANGNYNPGAATSFGVTIFDGVNNSTNYTIFARIEITLDAGLGYQSTRSGYLTACFIGSGGVNYSSFTETSSYKANSVTYTITPEIVDNSGVLRFQVSFTNLPGGYQNFHYIIAVTYFHKYA